MSQRLTSDLQVRRLAAVVACIREVSSVPHDDGIGFHGLQHHPGVRSQVPQMRTVGSSLRVSPQHSVFPTMSSGSSTGPERDYETKYRLLFLHEQLSLPAHVTHRTPLCALGFSVLWSARVEVAKLT